MMFMMEVIVDWCVVILLGCLYTRCSSLPSTGWLPQWTVGLVVTISRARRPCHRRPMTTLCGWAVRLQRRSREGTRARRATQRSSSWSLFLAIFMVYEGWKWFGVVLLPTRLRLFIFMVMRTFVCKWLSERRMRGVVRVFAFWIHFYCVLNLFVLTNFLFHILVVIHILPGWTFSKQMGYENNENPDKSVMHKWRW